jgi:hypothetical protein
MVIQTIQKQIITQEKIQKHSKEINTINPQNTRTYTLVKRIDKSIKILIMMSLILTEHLK